METITGVVESVRKDRKGMCVNGQWYSSWDALSVNTGDEVLFNYVEKGTFKNIKGKVRVTGSKPVTSSGGGKSGGYSNLGVEIGHAANLAMEMMKQDKIELDSEEYYGTFATRTVSMFNAMKEIRSIIEKGEGSTSTVTKVDKDDMDDIF